MGALYWRWDDFNRGGGLLFIIKCTHLCHNTHGVNQLHCLKRGGLINISSIHINRLLQCDQTFSAVITKRCAEILPNSIFFYQTRANSAF